VDGREFIRQSPIIAWTDPFPSTAGPPISRKQALKTAREKRDKANASAASTSTTPSASASTSVPGIDQTANEIADLSISTRTVEPQLVDHYIMNLPDSALTFLDAFRGLLTPLKSKEGFEARLKGLENGGRPLIHVYCFTREMEEDGACRDICHVCLVSRPRGHPADQIQRASSVLGHTITPSTDSFHLHLVRKVAPNKDMYCLTFRLPEEVAFASRDDTVDH
jgi:tRNA (guanine37-N1)-methyltransferase